MKKTRVEKGITLIALIITIVVLLILATVAISSIQNDGILGYATNSTNHYNQAVKNEQTILQDYLDFLKVNDKNSSILDGKGTETEPYVISSIEDLILFAYDVNQGNSYQGKYVKLEKDLDFNSDASYEDPYRTNYGIYGYEGNLKTALTTGEGFIPIGTIYNNGDAKNATYFSGIFDGKGKTISNLRINKENIIINDIGLFTLNQGLIKNFGVNNCNININPTVVSNVNVNCGAICGYNWGKIDSCWASGSIEATHNTDGVLRVGGIVGGSDDSKSADAYIINCYNKTNINVSSSESKLFIGGIIGGITNTISNCYNVGSVSVEHTGANPPYIGGILGLGSVKLSRCYNIGQVSCKDPDRTPLVGGVAGSCIDAEYCCNIGTVTYEVKKMGRIGTLFGYCEGTLSNSYTLNHAVLNGIGTNISSTSEPTKVNTVAEMPTILEIVGNGFKADTNNINNGYPILSWQ